MKFGKVEHSELDTLDLKLPEDHPDTATALRSGIEKVKVYVGCAKWGRK